MFILCQEDGILERYGDYMLPDQCLKKVSFQMRTKAILTIVYVTMVLAYWILFYQIEFRNLNVSFVISELIGIGEYLILLLTIVAIVLQIKSIKQKETKIGNAVLLLILILVLICSFGDTYYTAHGLNTGGLVAVADKGEKDGTYYFCVDQEYRGKVYSLQLECDELTYDRLIEDEDVQYHIEFIWNTLTPHTGFLATIDLDDFCDNR